MKTWTLPVSVAQNFSANDYVAACYRVYCGSPLGNASYTNLYADTNLNGEFDEGDVSVVSLPYEGATMRGCGGYHRVVGEGYPANNGLVEIDGVCYPVFFWTGEVMDSTVAGAGDYHVADLTAPDAVITNESPNHS